eukprot:363174-Chlamydomonas_euryale.AAC.1
MPRWQSKHHIHHLASRQPHPPHLPFHDFCRVTAALLFAGGASGPVPRLPPPSATAPPFPPPCRRIGQLRQLGVRCWRWQRPPQPQIQDRHTGHHIRRARRPHRRMGAGAGGAAAATAPPAILDDGGAADGAGGHAGRGLPTADGRRGRPGRGGAAKEGPCRPGAEKGTGTVGEAAQSWAARAA